MNQRTCATCGATFTPGSGRQRFCPACKPSRHPTVTTQCGACGKSVQKQRSQMRRFTNVYCSFLCRNYATYGASSVTLPKEHWARWFGKTSEWSPGSQGFQCGMCDDCATPITEPANQTPSVYCSDRCRARSASRRRKGREHNAAGYFRASEVIAQYRRQGHVCAYCRTPVIGQPEPEHVLALSRGGRNDMSNIVAACKLCNSDKCDMTLDEWKLDRNLRGKDPVAELTGAAYVHLWMRAATGQSDRAKRTSSLVA